MGGMTGEEIRTSQPSRDLSYVNSVLNVLALRGVVWRSDVCRHANVDKGPLRSQCGARQLRSADATKARARAVAERKVRRLHARRRVRSSSMGRSGPEVLLTQQRGEPRQLP